MSSEADRLISYLKSRSLEKFTTLCKMHLSFLLDFSGSSLEEFLESSAEDKAGDKPRVFGNFSRRKSVGDLKNLDGRSVFGAPLTTLTIERIRPLIDYLNSEENLRQEGIFRKSGNVSRQKILQDKIDNGYDIKDDLKCGKFSPHDCASVLKLFLGKLPEPLLTEKHYTAHCQIAELTNEERKLQTLQILMNLLPDENFILLKHLLPLLYRVAHTESTLMTTKTLGTLFAPHLLVPKKINASELHVKNPIITGVVAFIIEKCPSVFCLPDALLQDINSCLHDGEMRNSPCFHLSRLDFDARPKVSYDETDSNVVKTSVSFTDRAASLKAATQTDTVTALGELYAHIANLPESSKKRKLLKQFNKASATETTPVDTKQKHRRSKSLTQSIKKLIGYTKKTPDAVKVHSSSDEVSPTHDDSLTKQFHTPIIKQRYSRHMTTALQQQPPLVRHFKSESHRPMSILPSSLKLSSFDSQNHFTDYNHPPASSGKGHSWTNLNRRATPQPEVFQHDLSSDSRIRVPSRHRSRLDACSFGEMRETAANRTSDKEEQTKESEFVSPVRQSPPYVRLSFTPIKKS